MCDIAEEAAKANSTDERQKLTVGIDQSLKKFQREGENPESSRSFKHQNFKHQNFKHQNFKHHILKQQNKVIQHQNNNETTCSAQIENNNNTTKLSSSAKNYYRKKYTPYKQPYRQPRKRMVNKRQQADCLDGIRSVRMKKTKHLKRVGLNCDRFGHEYLLTEKAGTSETMNIRDSSALEGDQGNEISIENESENRTLTTEFRDTNDVNNYDCVNLNFYGNVYLHKSDEMSTSQANVSNFSESSYGIYWKF